MDSLSVPRACANLSTEMLLTLPFPPFRSVGGPFAGAFPYPSYTWDLIPALQATIELLTVLTAEI